MKSEKEWHVGTKQLLEANKVKEKFNALGSKKAAEGKEKVATVGSKKAYEEEAKVKYNAQKVDTLDSSEAVSWWGKEERWSSNILSSNEKDENDVYKDNESE